MSCFCLLLSSSGSLPYCAVPCHAMPCSTMPFLAALCCALLHHTVLCPAVPHWALLHCDIPSCPVPCHAMPRTTTLFPAASRHIMLCPAVPYRAISSPAMLCHADLTVLCYAVPCNALPYPAVPGYAMLNCALLCMSSHAVLSLGHSWSQCPSGSAYLSASPVCPQWQRAKGQGRSHK